MNGKKKIILILILNFIWIIIQLELNEKIKEVSTIHMIVDNEYDFIAKLNLTLILNELIFNLILNELIFNWILAKIIIRHSFWWKTDKIISF